MPKRVNNAPKHFVMKKTFIIIKKSIRGKSEYSVKSAKRNFISWRTFELMKEPMLKKSRNLFRVFTVTAFIRLLCREKAVKEFTRVFSNAR